jgi:hypothetical protein
MLTVNANLATMNGKRSENVIQHSAMKLTVTVTVNANPATVNVNSTTVNTNSANASLGMMNERLNLDMKIANTIVSYDL